MHQIYKTIRSLVAGVGNISGILPIIWTVLFFSFNNIIEAQTPFAKNTFFLGGEVQAVQHAYNYNTTKTLNIKVAPSFGYFIFNRLAVGINAAVQYEREYDPASAYVLFSDATSLEYSVSPFMRYYFPLKSHFGLIAHLQGTYYHFSPKDYFTPPPTDISVSAGIGVYYFLNHSVTLEMLLTDKISDRSYGDLVFNDAKRTSAINLSIGVQCYLNSKTNMEEQPIAPVLSRGSQTLGGTFNWTNSVRNPTNNFSVRPSYGYFVLKNLALEATAFYETTGYQTSNSSYTDTEFGAGLSLAYYQKIFRRLYIVPRAGIGRSHYDRTTDPLFKISTRHSFDGSLNLNYFLSNSFALEAGVGYKVDIFDQPIISPDKLARYDDLRGFFGFKYFIRKK